MGLNGFLTRSGHQAKIPGAGARQRHPVGFSSEGIKRRYTTESPTVQEPSRVNLGRHQAEAPCAGAQQKNLVETSDGGTKQRHPAEAPGEDKVL